MLTYAYVVLMNRLASLKSEEGQGMVEYALIIAVISIVLVLAAAGLEGNFTTWVTDVGAKIKVAP